MTPEIRQILSDVRAGRPAAVDELFPLVYRELRRLAAALLRRERPDHTLQTTALVNEAYVRLAGEQNTDWRDHAHFCAVAARAMRQILVDHARRRNRAKRGGKNDRVPLDSALIMGEERTNGTDVEALDTALTRLAAISPRAVSVVEMRFFGGLSVEETAAVLDVSVSSVEREWRYARAWLARELQAHHGEAEQSGEHGDATRTARG